MKRFVHILVFAAVVLTAATGASGASNVGYDISYPQCGGAFPSGGAFGIVGVNDGRPFSANPCLGVGSSASELQWAGMNAGLYANTADPGPALSTHWPNGQTAPKQCNTTSNPGSDTPECHYDYGWNAAADGYQDAVSAYVALGWAPTGSTHTPVGNEWWLDVETANSWTSTPSLNIQALEGEVDYLSSAGAANVGFYSSLSAWQTITGSTAAFGSYPSWVAGATSLTDAQSRCGGAGFTGGGIALAQFVSGGVDNDYHCATQPALQFATQPQTLIAGTPSSALAVHLAQPAAAATSVTVTSMSAKGVFATSSAGPWTATLTLAVAANATSTGSFYYEDTSAGSPTLTAAATGYTNGTQTETVDPAVLASITVSPSNPQVKVGSTVTFTAAGADAYGNSVAVAPTWSVTPALGTFSPASGSRTVFTAKVTGTGTVAATSGTTSGTTPVTVVKKRR